MHPKPSNQQDALRGKKSRTSVSEGSSYEMQMNQLSELSEGLIYFHELLVDLNTEKMGGHNERY